MHFFPNALPWQYELGQHPRHAWSAHICRHCDNTFECIDKTTPLKRVFWRSFILLFYMCLSLAQFQFQMELISFSFSVVPIANGFLFVEHHFSWRKPREMNTLFEICRASDTTACWAYPHINVRRNSTQLNYLLFLFWQDPKIKHVLCNLIRFSNVLCVLCTNPLWKLLCKLRPLGPSKRSKFFPISLFRHLPTNKLLVLCTVYTERPLKIIRILFVHYWLVRYKLQRNWAASREPCNGISINKMI